MYSNKQLKGLLQTKKKKANALKKQSKGGGCCGGNVKLGIERYNISKKPTTQKIFKGVYNAKNKSKSLKPLYVRGGELRNNSFVNHSFINHSHIVNAQNKYIQSWQRRNNLMATQQ